MKELKCLQCGHIWQSNKNPLTCPKKGCRSWAWYRAKRTTRIISDEKREQLREMAGNRKGTHQTAEHIAKRMKGKHGKA